MSVAAVKQRDQSIDFVRGLVMVLMVLDHARDFISGFGSPTNLETTTPALFFTRWITHFCAPVFVFLAGLAASIYAGRHGPKAATRFLASRGVWLILLEVTVIKFTWAPEPAFRFIVLQVIWAIGWSMLALSLLSRLPVRVLFALGLGIVFGHNLLSGIHADELGAFRPAWSFLFERNALVWDGRTFFVAYPVVPWLGVMLLGFSARRIFELDTQARRKAWFLWGGAALVGFVVLRLANGYGDPQPWSVQKDALFTVMSFLNCEKYPPSLAYALMTLGPALLLLGLMTGRTVPKWLSWVSLFGQVPLFYYIAHLYLLRIGGVIAAYSVHGPRAFDPSPGPAGSPGWPLIGAYAGWLLALLLLYPLCRWFAKVKRTNDAWWLKYL